MDPRLKQITITSPCQLGATVFREGATVEEVIKYAMQAFKNAHPAVAPKDEKKPPRDPWMTEMYALTTEYHLRTGNKVMIRDLLDLFFAHTVHDLDEDDRPLFEARLRERLA